MATVLGLAMKITADASGLRQSLSPVDRALKQLGEQASASASLFDKFISTTSAAGAAQRQFATDVAFLTSELKRGLRSPEEFAAEFAKLQATARDTAAAFAEGARITDATRTAEERRAAELQKLDGLLQQGAFSAETYARAVAGLAAGFDGSSQERFAAAIAKLQQEAQGGAATFEAFRLQASQIAQAIESSTPAAQRSAEAILALRAQLDAGKIGLEQYRAEFSKIQSGDFASTFTVQVLGVREGVEATDQLKASIATITDKQLQVALNLSGVSTLDELRARLDNIDGRKVDALLTLLGVDTIDQAIASVTQLDGSDISVAARLQAIGLKDIEQANALLSSLSDKNVTATAEALGLDNVEQLKNLLGSVESKNIEVQASTNADETAARVKALVDEQNNYLRLVEEARRLNESAATAEDKRAAALQRLEAVNATGELSLKAYNAEAIKILGINEQAAQSEKQRADALARGAQITESVLTPLERYDRKTQELIAAKQAATISEETFNRALAKATQEFTRAEAAAKGYGDVVQKAGQSGGLAFNELAGTLAVLPGPIGNVAGRLSGITTASEGLNRTLANGGGISQFGTALAGLVNPTTLALGALAGFGAGAVAVGRNLVQLEGEVERLGQLADRLGVSFGFIQVLETAANQTGGSVEELGGSFTKFLRTVDEARNGGKNAAQAFRDLGLSTEEVRGSNPEQLFTQAAQAIAEIDDPARRAAAAVALFGKSGADLLPVFRQVGTAASDLERIGGAITDQQRADIDAFGDAMDRAGVAAQGLERQVTSGFSRIGRSIADSVAESIGAINRFLQEQQKFNEASDLRLAEQGIGTLTEPIEQLRARLERAKEAKDALANRPVTEFAASLVDTSDSATQLNDELNKALEKAAQFGNAGVQAVFGFAKSLEDIAAAGEGAALSEEQLARAVAASRKDFDLQIDLLQRESEAQKKAADAASKAADDRIKAAERIVEADRQRADAFIRQQGLGDDVDAAETLLSITRQIDEAETAIVQARAKGDADAEKAALRRLQILDQAKAAAQDTVDFGFNAGDIQLAIRGAQKELDGIISKVAEFGDAGRKAAQDLQAELADAGVNINIGNIGDRFGQAGVQAGLEFQKGLEDAGVNINIGNIGERFGQAGVQAGLEFQKGLEAAQSQLDAKLIDPKQFDEAIQKQGELFNERLQQLGQIRDLELQIIKERGQLEEERIDSLRKTAQKPLTISDVRTQQGASEFLRLATGREDPAIAEYRKQLDALRRLENKLDRLAAEPVDIRG